MPKIGSKYEPLYHFFQGQGMPTAVELSLAQIEAILGTSLPDSARRQRGWWSNRAKGGNQAQAWLAAGYQVAAIDLQKETIRFERPGVVYRIRRRDGEVQWDAPLVKALRYQMGLSQAAFARELGVRQATVSEWETAAYEPTRSSSKLLSLIAERAGFEYRTTAEPTKNDKKQPDLTEK